MPRGRGRGRGRVGNDAGAGKGRGRGRGGQSVGQFLAPRNGRQAGATANAQASAEHNPEIRELRSQAKGSRQREQDLGSWYAQLAADYQGAQSAGATALQSIQDTTSAQLAEAGQRSSADLAKLSADDEAFAKLTGGPKDTAGLSQIAQAGAAAERSRVALSQPVAAEQAHFVGRLGGDKTAARMQGIEERRSEQRRRDKIRSDLTSVRKEKGAARVGKKEEIREADRGYATELKKLKMARQEARTAEQQAAADAAIAQVEAARSAREGAADRRQAQERIGISRRNAKTGERSQKATAKNYKEDGNGGMTPSQKRTARRSKNSANVAAQTLYKSAGSPNWSAKQWNTFVQRVAMEEGIDYTAAAKAVASLRQAVAAKRRGGYDKRARKGEVAGPPSPGR